MWWSRDLVQPPAAELILDAQPVQLLVAFPAALARLSEGAVVLLEELVERRHSPLRLGLAPRVGAELDLGLQALGSSAGLGEVDVRSATDLLVAGLPVPVLVAQEVRALPGRGGGDEYVQTARRCVIVDKLEACLSGRAAEFVANELLG